MGNIEHGFNACRAAHEGFNSKANLPPLGSDAVSIFYIGQTNIE